MGILEYQFFQNALCGSLLACIACGIIGTYIVTRRLVFISGGITHAGFGGIGLGMYMGVAPTATAFLFAATSALGVQWLGNTKNIREDSAIAVFWILGMSLGIIFCFMSPGYNTELSTYLFGNILTITGGDIALLAVISCVLLLFGLVFHKAITMIAFDREFAVSRGIPVWLFESIMMLFVAVTIVGTLRLIGVVLVMSMLTIPQMTSMLFTHNYNRIILFSVLVGYVATLLGLYISYHANIPSGATITLCSIIIYIMCRVCCAIFRKGNKKHFL